MSSVPKTPPRTSRRNQFQTPKTPNFDFTSKQFKTPSTSHTNHSVFSNQLPITPEYTPHKSNRKKKISLEDIFTNNQSSSILQPNPSTVGSGRKYNVIPPTPDTIHHTKNKSVELHLPLEVLSKINKNLNFEIEDDSSMDDDIEESDFEETDNNDKDYQEIKLTKLKSFKNDIAVESFRLSKSPSIEPNFQTDPYKAPTTPAGQKINDTMINQWFGKSFNNQFSSDEEEDEEIIRKSIKNPFVKNTIFDESPFNSTSSTKNIGNIFNKRSNMDKTVTLINKNGEKSVRNLTAREQLVKPKKLNFNKFLDDSEEENKEEQLATKLNRQGLNKNRSANDGSKHSDYLLGEKFVNRNVKFNKIDKFNVFVDNK